MTKYEGNQYRVVADHDRNTTVKTFATRVAAEHYCRWRKGHEIQTAVETEDGGEVAWYVRGARDLPCFDPAVK